MTTDNTNNNIMDDELRRKAYALEEVIQNVPESLQSIDPQFWVMDVMSSLLTMCADYRQKEYPDLTVDRFLECKRVVKARRSIPVQLLDRYHEDYRFMSGVYIAVEGILVSPIIMQSYFGMTTLNREEVFKPTKLYDPVTDLGAPDTVEWSTIQLLANGYGFALKKSKLVPRFLAWSSAYEYLEL